MYIQWKKWTIKNQKVEQSHRAYNHDKKANKNTKWHTHLVHHCKTVPTK